MFCLGLEPSATGWKAQTDPLSFEGHPSRLFVLYCWPTRPLQDDFLLSTLGQASYISCISEISFLAPPFIILILNIRSETRQQLLEFIWLNVFSKQYCQSSGKIVVNGQILYK